MYARTLNPAQLEILEMTSFVNSDEMLVQMKQAIASYFAKMAQDEIDRLWETGELSEKKVESFRNLHERTPYK
ncbi:MAG: dephospho-CoA kinase [Bacteroidales bacterium]|nr:dephospho-CoA kinase [Bacteroidales bacterium]